MPLSFSRNSDPRSGDARVPQESHQRAVCTVWCGVCGVGGGRVCGGVRGCVWCVGGGAIVYEGGEGGRKCKCKCMQVRWGGSERSV